MTNYNSRSIPSTTYNWWRPGITYIMTEILDYLMTEDNDYLITDESIYNEYTARWVVTSTYTNRPIIS